MALSRRTPTTSTNTISGTQVFFPAKPSSAFAERYSKLAAEMAAKETDAVRKEELLKISEICARVPKKEPRNFWEALQFLWFIHLTIQIEDNGHSIAFGRLDQNLYPYYKKDVVDGTLEQDQADELLPAFSSR